MKQKTFLAIIFCLMVVFSAPLFCQEEAENNPKFSFGGGIFSNNISAGGFADFAFILVKKSNFDFGLNLLLRYGALGETKGIVSFSHKFSAGLLFFDIIHPYIYVEEGISGWGDNNKNGFFDGPVMYCFGGGGGIDIFLNKMFSIFAEPQYIGYWGSEYGKNCFMIQIGWRGFF